MRTAVRMLVASAIAVAATAVGFGAASAHATPPATGQRQAFVIRMTWAGATDATSEGLVGAITGGVNTWMRTASRNQFSGWTVSDLGVITITKPTLSPGQFPCDNTFLNAMHVPAEQAALNRGYNINDFEVVVYWFPGQPCGWSGLGDLGGLRVHLNGTIDQHVLVHELGHHLGLNHAHTLICKDASGTVVTLSTSCASDEYGDFVNEMGTGLGTYSAPQLADIGWMVGLVTTVPPGGGTYFVSPLDSQGSGNVHALRIPDGSETIWVEYRQPGNLDSADLHQGVFLHLQRPDGSVTPGSYLLLMSPSNGVPQLPLGATWQNPLGHMKITVDSTSTLAVHITVTTTLKKIPNVVTADVATATSMLAAVGLHVGSRTTINTCVDPGTIQSQNPSPDALVGPGTAVDVMVSACPAIPPGEGGGGGVQK